MTTDPRFAGIDVRRADAAYESFPSFAEWLGRSEVDRVRWDRYSALLKSRGDLIPDVLARAREVAKRAAAVDTGAIEGLYEVDRGFTFSVALQLAEYEALVDAKGPAVRPLIEAQMSAYDFVLDFATRRAPIVEAWIRKLHEIMCESQETYLVHTGVGVQKQRLPLGQYKSLPNHVLRSDGRVHSHAPVELVPAEMQRLCAELASEPFAANHPVQQASYAHYALVRIHPFADGNGRVARALASMFSYRALSVPIVVLAEHRGQYLAALEAADSGGYQAFVSFLLERTLDSIQLVAEMLKAANAPEPGAAVAELGLIYVTQGGFSQADVDHAGSKLFDAFIAEVRRRAEQLRTRELRIDIEAGSDFPIGDPRYRRTSTFRIINIQFKTAPPAAAEASRRWTVEVPKDAGREDDLVLRCYETSERFEARITEASPSISGTVQLRLRIFVDGFLGRGIAEVTSRAQAGLQK